MVFKSIIGATCVCLLSITATQSVASVIYTYTGNQFDAFSSPSSYDASMSVTITLVLDSALDSNLSFASVLPLSFNFSDGVNTLTQNNAGNTTVEFSTDETGSITEWLVFARENSALTTVGDTQFFIETLNSVFDVLDQGVISTCTTTANCNVNLNRDSGGINDAPGTWTVSTVPVPAAVWLFGSGLIGLVGLARRKT